MALRGKGRWASLVVLLAAFAASVRHGAWAARCRVAMAEQTIPEEARWRAWPILPGLAGYTVVDLAPFPDLGWTSARPHATGDARLAGAGVCAERGVSVQSWLGQYFIAISGNDWTLRAREEPRTGAVLVTGERTRPEQERFEPRPIVAFRREPDGLLKLAVRVAVWPLASLAALFAWWRSSKRRPVPG